MSATVNELEDPSTIHHRSGVPQELALTTLISLFNIQFMSIIQSPRLLLI